MSERLSRSSCSFSANRGAFLHLVEKLFSFQIGIQVRGPQIFSCLGHIHFFFTNAGLGLVCRLTEKVFSDSSSAIDAISVFCWFQFLVGANFSTSLHTPRSLVPALHSAVPVPRPVLPAVALSLSRRGERASPAGPGGCLAAASELPRCGRTKTLVLNYKYFVVFCKYFVYLFSDLSNFRFGCAT